MKTPTLEFALPQHTRDALERVRIYLQDAWSGSIVSEAAAIRFCINSTAATLAKKTGGAR